MLRNVFIIESPQKNFLLLILTIFLSEIFISLLINLFSINENWIKIIFNATTLILILIPLLYFLVFTPLTQNIYKRKITERQLGASQLRFQSLYDENPSIFLTISPEGMIFSVNEYGAKYLGYQIEELIGQSIFDLIFEIDNELVQSKINQCTNCKTEIDIPEIQLYKKDKSNIWSRILMRTTCDSFGNVVIHAVCEDITKRKEVESELIIAKDKAEETSKLKSSILDNLSHEFRTPLNNIIGFSQLLSISLIDSENKNLLTTILSSAKRLLNTLDSIYLFSQLKSNSINIDLKKNNLIKICKSVTEEFKSEALQKNIVLTFSSQSENLNVFIDEFLFSIAVRNIIKNAIIFTEQGKVSVDVNIDRINNNEVKVSVKDTGTGIHSEQIETIFHEFRQASEGINRNYEGAGLGLSISKKIIEKLNGRISVESKFNEGTIVTIIIPDSFN